MHLEPKLLRRFLSLHSLLLAANLGRLNALETGGFQGLKRLFGYFADDHGFADFAFEFGGWRRKPAQQGKKTGGSCLGDKLAAVNMEMHKEVVPFRACM